MRRPSIGLFLGRPERSAFLARRLRARGFDVTHYNHTGYEDDPWVPVRGGFARELAHVLLHTKHDVYVTGLSHAPAIALCANRWLRGRPFVFNATGAKWEMFCDQSRGRPFPRVFERWVHPFLLGRTYRGASRIVANSRFLARKVAQRYPRIRDRVETIYNGIDFSRYASARPAALAPGRPGDLVVACVTTANFANKVRGLDLVLEAFDRLHARRPHTKLVVAAKCADARYREAIEKRASALAACQAIELRFNEPDVPGLLAAADLFAFATPDDSNDSLPRALIEAQAAGLAAVTTSTSGCPEIVADGETGLVVAYDADAIAVALARLADDADERERLSRRAGRLAREVFDWDRMADGYARVFEEITA